MKRQHIGQAVRDIMHGTRKLRQFAGAGKQDWSLMFHGFGNVAKEALFHMLARSEICDSLKLVYMVCSDPLPSKQGVKKHHLELYARQAKTIAPHIDFQPLFSSDAPGHISDVDLCFVTANTAPAGLHRKEMLRYNLGLIPGNPGMINSLCDLVKAGPSTLFEIESTLGEVIAAAVYEKTKCDPTHLLGGCNVDKLRLDRRIIQDFAEQQIVVNRTEGYCVGYHDKPHVVLTGLRVGVDRDFVAVDNPTSNTQEAVVKFIREYGPRMAYLAHLAKVIELNVPPTAKETGAAMAYVADALFNGDRLVNASMYDGKTGLWLAGPTYGENYVPRPNRALLNRMSPDDKAALAVERSNLEQLMSDCSVRVRKTNVTLPFETVNPVALRRTREQLPVRTPRQQVKQISEGFKKPLDSLSEQNYSYVHSQQKANRIIPAVDRKVPSRSSFFDFLDDAQEAVYHFASTEFGKSVVTLALVAVLGGGMFYGAARYKHNSDHARTLIPYFEKNDPFFLRHVFKSNPVIGYEGEAIYLREVTHTVYSRDKSRALFVHTQYMNRNPRFMVFNMTKPLQLRAGPDYYSVSEIEWEGNSTVLYRAREEEGGPQKYMKFNIDETNRIINVRENPPDSF
jgi:hypothetical protein